MVDLQTPLLQIQRDAIIVNLISQRGIATVHELSESCAVTEVTIRRDLQRLEAQGLVRRTHGGATLPEAKQARSRASQAQVASTGFIQSIDALIMTYARTQRGHLLLEQAQQRGIPIIAESEAIDGTTYVGIDHYRATYALGEWVARHATMFGDQPIRVLDVTYYFPNTRERSQGFIDGLTAHQPSAELVLSVDGHALKSDTYSVVKDALTVHPEINLIFAINDDCASGALDACRAAGRRPDEVRIVWVGLEGVSTRRELAGDSHLIACAAMFPEIVAWVALQTADSGDIQPGDDHVIFTPSAVLTRENLTDYYQPEEWDKMQSAAYEALIAPYLPSQRHNRSAQPTTIGFVVPFNTHDWYRTITDEMVRHADKSGVELLIEDATASPTAELAWLSQNIAQTAASLIRDGDTILLDHDPICAQIASAIVQTPSSFTSLTIITNSLAILNTLRADTNANSSIKLILTGGEVHANGYTLIGRAAELMLSDYRATKAFIGLAAISEDYGLSAPDHTLAQVQRAMIVAANEVYLLTDHTRIGIGGQARIMPIDPAHTLITDAGIAAPDRLRFNRLGMRVITATAPIPLPIQNQSQNQKER